MSANVLIVDDLPESPLDVLSRAASMVESGHSTSPGSSSSSNTSPTTNNVNNKFGGECERSPSFKERHPKFRKSATPDYLLAAADHHHSRNLLRLQRQHSDGDGGGGGGGGGVSAPTTDPGGVGAAEDGPLDMSIKKQRSESPPPPPPYRYTPLRRSPPPPRLGELTPPPPPHLSVPIQPVYLASSKQTPPPPYPTHSPSPPLDAFRPPPPSYESATLKCTYLSPPSVRRTQEQEMGSESIVKSKLPFEKMEVERTIREITIITDSSADPLLDEHFRRSLGADYQTLFKKDVGEKSVQVSSPSVLPNRSQGYKKSPEEEAEKSKDPIKAFQEDMEMEGYTVEDHFAKALGETWLKLQAQKDIPNSEKPPSSSTVTTVKPALSPKLSPAQSNQGKPQLLAL